MSLRRTNDNDYFKYCSGCERTRVASAIYCELDGSKLPELPIKWKEIRQSRGHVLVCDYTVNENSKWKRCTRGKLWDSSGPDQTCPNCDGLGYIKEDGFEYFKTDRGWMMKPNARD